MGCPQGAVAGLGVTSLSSSGFWQGRRVLVTGHTGFKGGWLLLMLRQLGADVHGFALPPPTKPSLFELLEQTIVPMFYDRAGGPMPRRWLATVRRSISTLGPRVLAERMVREYTDDFYGPTADRAERLSADGFARARELAAWRSHMTGRWGDVAIREVAADQSVAAIGQSREVRVAVKLGELGPENVRVELLHGAVRADGVLVDPKTLALELAEHDGGTAAYVGAFEIDASGEYGMAARVVPSHRDLSSWSDTGLVVWADPEGVEGRTGSST